MIFYPVIGLYVSRLTRAFSLSFLLSLAIILPQSLSAYNYTYYEQYTIVQHDSLWKISKKFYAKSKK